MGLGIPRRQGSGLEALRTQELDELASFLLVLSQISRLRLFQEFFCSCARSRTPACLDRSAAEWRNGWDPDSSHGFRGDAENPCADPREIQTCLGPCKSDRK